MAGVPERAHGTRRRTGQESAFRSHEDWQQLCGEFNICKRKLQAKAEGLLVLAKELDTVRQEKDAFKLMAEQLREKFQAQRKKYEERERALGLSLNESDPLSERRNHSLVQILCESREKNRRAELELTELRQKLAEADGDIKLLRENIARQRIGDEGIGTRHFPAHEREELIKQLEKSREQVESLERDMVAKIDEQQEIVTERDYYRTKSDRLNQELNYVLGGDDRRILDIDALVMENKYLKERLNQCQEEKSTVQAMVSKYKAALERRRGRGVPKLGSSNTILSAKDVENLLAEGKSGGLSASPASVSDLQALATSLLENIHDKTMALTHQKSTNKILGQRVAELEKKLKTLEIAGLWNLPAGAGGRSAAFLAKERENMALGPKSLLPHQVSSGSDDSGRSPDGSSSLPSSAKSTPHSTPSHRGHQKFTRSDTEDSLILLEDRLEDSQVDTEESKISLSDVCNTEGEAEDFHEEGGENSQDKDDESVDVNISNADAETKLGHNAVIANERLVSDVDREGAVSGDNDAQIASITSFASDVEIVGNRDEMERGEADGEDTAGDDALHDDEEEEDADEDDNSEGIEDEETTTLCADTCSSENRDTISAATTTSLENLFESVSEKFSMKTKEKKENEGEESTHPSSPLLKKEKRSKLLVVDTSPQCV